MLEILRDLVSVLSYFVLPALLVGFPLYGLYKGVRVYEVFVEGAKEGFNVAVTIIPYLIAILFAIGMFRASGAMDFLVDMLDPVLAMIGVPAEVVPMGVIRPLTGSGSAGLVADMIQQYGEDSLVVKMVATMFGSTETTFYVIAVYFGAVNVRETRHAVPAGLFADFIGFLASVYVVQLLFG
ncbi:spore maturation protein [Longibacter salinarum]|uniref:Spore maturation protein n=1 Tax=Longibacter salinarum TaxID=1850348 RepID=A0A2A8D1I7_9BACT|nr:spore maturation protein [Longibacter salinarum]PEN14751.1 spore maturation protein [Longibacter salinarum]